MPYTDAVYREVMRMRPVLPMGLPHTSTEDDVYNGYLIPKGRILLPIFQPSFAQMQQAPSCSPTYGEKYIFRLLIFLDGM